MKRAVARTCDVRRIIVLGGRGFFGATVLERLRATGAKPLMASRCAGVDLRVDAEDHASIKSALRRGDVIVDAAGPFQDRTGALANSAIEIGFDLIDISDSLAYASKICALRQRIESAGIRVLTSCSSVSAVTAALVRLSGIEEPLRVTTCLVPATRVTANRGAAVSLLRSVGRPVSVRRNGRQLMRQGWRESRLCALPSPIGAIRAYLVETSDSLLLPALWPSLRDVDFFVHSNVPGLNQLLRVAARYRGLRSGLQRVLPLVLPVAKWIGREMGAFAVEVEGKAEIVVLTLVSLRTGHYTAAVPAAMAAKAIAEERFPERGLVPPDRHVDPEELVGALRALDIHLHSARSRSAADPPTHFRL